MHIHNLWLGLLMQSTVFISVVALWSNARWQRRRFASGKGRVLLGVSGAIAALSLMSLSINPAAGIFFDLRTTAVTLSAFFGGPLSALLTTLPAAIYRLYLGGEGAPSGIMALALSAVVGTYAHVRFARQSNWISIVGMSAVNALLMVLPLAMLPDALRGAIAAEAAIPLATTTFLTSLIAGLMILSELRRRELERVNRVYEKAILALPDCLNVKDTSGHFVIANAATARLMKADSREALIGKSDFDFFPPDIALTFRKDEENIQQSGQSAILEQRAAYRDGSEILLSTLKVPIYDRGELIGLISHNRDITLQRSLEQKLAKTRQDLDDAIANMAGGLSMFDAEGNLQFCNSQYIAMFPLTGHLRVPGCSFRELMTATVETGEMRTVSEELVGRMCDSSHELLRRLRTSRFQLVTDKWYEARAAFTKDDSCFIIYTDITAQKAQEAELLDLNKQLSKVAQTDGLTSLANRRAFDERLELELKRASRGGLPLSLLLIDIDRFKAFNDTYGHPAGDQCLRQIAMCVKAIAQRPSDLAVRYGGEEMAVILPLTNAEQAQQIAHRLRDLIHACAIQHSGSEHRIVTASMGIATIDANDPTDILADEFVNSADAALYAAKAAGRDSIRRSTGLRERQKLIA